MTVKELIAELERMPHDVQVVVDGNFGVEEDDRVVEDVVFVEGNDIVLLF